MKRIFLIISAIICANCAMAAESLVGGFKVIQGVNGSVGVKKDGRLWVGQYGNGVFTLLSPSREAALKDRIWVMESWGKGKKYAEGIRSLKAYYQLDCEERAVKILTVIGYSGYFGEGTANDTGGEPSNWHYVVPGSTGAFILDLGCSFNKPYKDQREGKK